MSPFSALSPFSASHQSDGNVATVTASSREEHPEGTSVCNLQVAGAHTYFVLSPDGQGVSVWVHNANYDRDLGAGIRALDGADELTFDAGSRYATTSKALYGELSWTERYSSTVAVSQTEVDGQTRDIYGINGGAPDSAKATIAAAAERDGAIYVEGVADQHAEIAIYEQCSNVETIGVSHYRGPCPACRSYFQNRNFFNLFYDSTFI